MEHQTNSALSQSESELKPGSTLAWLIWALSAAVATLLIRNPLYLVVIALGAWLVYLAVGQGQSVAHSWSGLIKLGAVVWFLAIPFNALMLHQGTHILFRLPSNWPLVGGAITLEAVLYGMVSGFALWTLLLVFVGFNVAVDASQLLRLMPPFLYQAGVVTSIAVTFMPQMLSSVTEIREAQQVRGHRFRGWRDFLPLVVPLLTTGFERAIQLAESMESRGFGGQLTEMSTGQSNGVRLALLGGLALLLGGLLVRSFWSSTSWLGVPLLICAALMLLCAFYWFGRRVRRSHYRRARWRRADTAITVVSLVVLIVTLLIRAANGLSLTYYPFPPYSLVPEFNPWIGTTLALLGLPGILNLLRRGKP